MKNSKQYYSPNNIKFMKPTKRVLNTPPPIQVFPPSDAGASVGDVAVAIVLVAALMVVLLWL